MAYGESAVSKAEQITEQVACGVALKDACRNVELSLSVFWEVLSGVREVAVRYARAREVRADILVEEALAAADNPELDPQRARNQIDIRKWIASKHHSRVYGDRVDLNVQQSISISDALAEARARLIARPLSDQPNIIDAQVIELPTISASKPTDSISEADVDDGLRSIFD